MGVSFVRTVILYFLVVASLRIMGKRQVGELQPSELVVAILASDLAAIPMQNSRIPLLAGIIPILTLVVLEVFISFAVTKSKKVQRVVTGIPSVLIHNGKVMKEEMERLRFTDEDLKEELRIAGADNIKEVQYAILETNGKLSVILLPENRPVTVKQVKKLLENYSK